MTVKTCVVCDACGESNPGTGGWTRVEESVCLSDGTVHQFAYDLCLPCWSALPVSTGDRAQERQAVVKAWGLK